jgi:hypothetical protein
MGDENSSSALPAGQYSSSADQYPAAAKTSTAASVVRSPEAVKVAPVVSHVTVSYDAREEATKRQIRRINGL